MDSAKLLEVARILWRFRKRIILVTALITLVTAGISLILPEYYRASASLMPETERAKLGGVGGLSELAAMAGVSVGGDLSHAKLYPTIMTSEAILRNVIFAKYRVAESDSAQNLIQLWEIAEKSETHSYELALKRLRDALEISLDNKTNVVTVAIEMEDAQLGADIVNRTVAELDEFFRTKRTTNATEQRKWIEGRLKEVEDDLRRSEDLLKAFREKNRRVEGSPQLLLQQERFLREVEINSTLYVELKKQYEIVRIEEIKNIPLVSIIDSATPRVYRERPKRRNMVLTFFLLALVGSSGFEYVREKNGQKIAAFVAELRKWN